MNMINPKSETYLRQHILPEETILWADQPARIELWILLLILFLTLIFGHFVFYPLVCSLISNDFSILDNVDMTYEGQQINSETDRSKVIVFLWSTIFFVGLYILLLLGFALSRYRQVYAITDHRVIIKRKAPFFGLSSLALSQIAQLNRTGGKKLGTITITNSNDGFMDKLLRLYQVKLSSFILIPNPEDVDALLLRQMQITQKVNP